MKMNFDLTWSGLFQPVPVYREDGSVAYTIRRLPLGSLLLFNESGERIGSISFRYNLRLGPDLYIGKAAHVKNLQTEWYQIHYFHFWTAEKIRGEDSYRVYIHQGEPIGTITPEKLSIFRNHYTLQAEDPKYFMMMILLSLTIYIKNTYKAVK